MDIKKVLILGGTGMLGHTLFTQLFLQPELDVHATARTLNGLSRWFSPLLLEKMWGNVEADNFDSITGVIASIRPDVVINCIGLIKQLPLAEDPLRAITINSLLPHRVAKVCCAAGARMIHISTDCVFDGKKGNYTENDLSNAVDLYGRSKFLGEIDYPHCVTLRTSIIGHELKDRYGLIEWFLAQTGKVRGFTNAIYSGFPTIELARIINQLILPNPDLKGIYHLSSDPISKYELLKLIAEKYSKNIEIEPYANFCLDRSLNSSIFRRSSGYTPPPWPELIDSMHQSFITAAHYNQSF